MVLVEQFFHLTEQNHVLISNLWRVLPMIFILTGSLSGIVYAFLFGQFKQRFSNRCVFFSELYQNTKPKQAALLSSTELTPRLSEIQWTSDETCHFLQFTPVFCSIFGFVVLSLFVMFGKGGNSTKNGLRAPWRIVMPSLLFSLIFSLLCVMSLRYYNRGIYQFCNDFLVLYFNNTADQSNCNLVINNVSAQVTLDVIKQNQRIGEYFHGRNGDQSYEGPYLGNTKELLQSNDLMYLCEMFLRIAMSAWILCALFLLIRIVTIVDFQLVRITVRTVEESFKEAAKSVKFFPVNTTSVYEVKGAYSEDDEDTETEAVTHSVDQSSVTLASPELSDDGIEMLELEKYDHQGTSQV